MSKNQRDFDQAAQERRQKYQNRLDVIRNPEINHMSRTRIKHDRFVKPKNEAGVAAAAAPGAPRRRQKAYDGAYVAEPRRQVPSGFKLLGRAMEHIHNFVIDMDLTSLYPSIMLICNLSPRTFVAKIFFRDKIEIPKYEYIKFIDNAEKHDYRCNSNDFFMETYVGKHWWAIGEIFLSLPTTDKILDHIEDRIGDFS